MTVKWFHDWIPCYGSPFQGQRTFFSGARIWEWLGAAGGTRGGVDGGSRGGCGLGGRRRLSRSIVGLPGMTGGAAGSELCNVMHMYLYNYIWSTICDYIVHHTIYYIIPDARARPGGRGLWRGARDRGPRGPRTICVILLYIQFDYIMWYDMILYYMVWYNMISYYSVCVIYHMIY